MPIIDNWLITRTNLAVNPRAISTAGNWAAYGSGTNSFVTGISDHPLGITTAASVSFVTANANPGVIWSTVLTTAHTYTVSVWARATSGAPITAGFAESGVAAGPDMTLTSSWQRFSWTRTRASNKFGFRARTGQTGTIQVTGLLLEEDPNLNDYFDPYMTSVDPYIRYMWSGSPDVSTSYLVEDERTTIPDTMLTLQLDVYRNTNLAGAPVEILNGRMNPTYLDELKGPGGGSFDIMVDDPKIQADPTLLDYRNVIKVKRGSKYLGAFVIQNTSEVFVDSSNEDAGRIISVSGEGLRTWFHDAIVYPYGGVTSNASDSRQFSWASEKGSWFVASQWKTPVKIMQPSHPSSAHAWSNLSAQGMPNQNSWWIWDRAENSVNKIPPNGYCYFRYEFDITAQTSYTFYIAADDTYTLYVDGQSLIDSGTYGVNNWQQVQSADVTLEKGHHIVAARVKNWGNIAGLNVDVYSTGSPSKPVKAHEIFNTGSPGWLVNGYPAKEPGWTSGAVLRKLLAEAKTRNVGFAQYLTPTFTDTTDSDGLAWNDAQAWSFNVGDDYETVLEKLEELSCEIWIDPNDYRLYAWANRGTDRGLGSDGPIAYRTGLNVITASEDVTGAVKNALLVKTTDGWSETTSSNSTSNTNYGRVEGTVQVDGGADLAKQVASYAFEEFSTPSTATAYEVISTDGSLPWTDVFVGDYVAAPKRGYQSLIDRRIYSLACGEDEAGNITYAIEFDTLPAERIDRLEKMLDNITAGTSSELLGAMSNIGVVKMNSSSDPSSSAPPSTPVTPSTVAPVAPKNVQGVSTPYYTSTGQSANTVSLTWDQVVLDIKGSAISVSTYEVWVRYSGQSSASSLATVVTNSFSNNNFPVGTTAYFTVRAQSAGGSWGAFSPEILVSLQTPFLTMDPPSAPVVLSSSAGALAHWDGLLGGIAPPPQFSYVYAETSTAATGTYVRQGATLHSQGDILLSTAPNTSFWVRFVAVDAQGNKTLPSVASQVTSLPATPQNFIVTSNTGTWDPSGTAISVVTLGWSPVTTDALGNAIVVDYYELWQHKGPDDPQHFVTSVNTTTVPIVMVPGDETQFSVRAHSTVGNYSDFTDDLDVLPLGPSQPLFQPSPPSLTTAHSALVATWDGTLNGDPPPPQFWHVLVERSDSDSGPWSPVGGPLEKAGTININDVDQGDVVWIRFTAYDHAGMASEPSIPVQLTVVGVDADDIVAGSITVNQLSPTIGGDLDITANDSVTIIAGQISDVQDGLNDTSDDLASMQTIYQFGSDGATISSPDSTFELKLTNEEIDIIQQGQVVSYWNSGQMFVDSFVGNEVVLGNHKLAKYGTGTVVKAL